MQCSLYEVSNYNTAILITVCMDLHLKMLGMGIPPWTQRQHVHVFM